MTKCDTHLWIQSNLKTLLSCDADIVGGKTQCTLGPSLRDSDTSLAKPLKGKKIRQNLSTNLGTTCTRTTENVKTL